MKERRQYLLMCPIARALDIVGDRWALLVLRDLHAGPARFQELQEGLGMATNLLSTRLSELIESGMVERADESRYAPYRLTDAGRRTDQVLWELARLGAGIERDDKLRMPESLRTIALPLRMLLESVDDRPTLVARLVVDDAEFTITSSAEEVHVEWGRTAEIVDLVARTNYEAFLDVGEGLMPIEEFAANHFSVDEGGKNAAAFTALMGAAVIAGM